MSELNPEEKKKIYEEEKERMLAKEKIKEEGKSCLHTIELIKEM